MSKQEQYHFRQLALDYAARYSKPGKVLEDAKRYYEYLTSGK